MRQFTIAERLIAAVLLSLSAMAAVPYLAAMTSHSLCREFPRYEVNFSARMEVNGTIADVSVHDVSEGGVRITAADQLAVGDEVALTFPGMKKIVGQIVRNGVDGCDVCFTPARLRPEELRDLVTAPGQAA